MLSGLVAWGEIDYRVFTEFTVTLQVRYEGWLTSSNEFNLVLTSFFFCWIFPTKQELEMEPAGPLLGFTGFYRVLLFLLSFTGFYWVLVGFTGFYWVLVGFTGFYWVLLGFTGF